MTRKNRMAGQVAGLIALAVAMLLSGCAQPGQLGAPEPTPVPAVSGAAVPAATTAPTTAPPAGPVMIGSGAVAGRVSMRTPGPAVFSVRTVVLPPGGTTGWHRHPGTEMSIVKSGAVSVLRKGACEPALIGTGQAVFIADAEPHLARNDGAEPAELVVTYLVAPEAQDRGDVPAACPGT